MITGSLRYVVPRFTQIMSCSFVIFLILTSSSANGLTVHQKDFGTDITLVCNGAQSNGTANWCNKASPKEDECRPLSQDSAPYIQLMGTGTLVVTINSVTLGGYFCRSKDGGATLVEEWILTEESRYLGLPDVIEAKYNVSEEVTVCFFPDPGDQLINMVLYLDGIERRQQDLREKSLDKLSFNIAFLTNSTIYFEATVSHNAQPLRSHNITVIVEKKPTTPNETTSPPTASPSLSTSNEGVIVGITVPIVLFVCITVAIIMTVIICKRKNGQLCQRPNTPANPEVPIPVKDRDDGVLVTTGGDNYLPDNMKDNMLRADPQPRQNQSGDITAITRVHQANETNLPQPQEPSQDGMTSATTMEMTQVPIGSRMGTPEQNKSEECSTNDACTELA